MLNHWVETPANVSRRLLEVHPWVVEKNGKFRIRHPLNGFVISVLATSTTSCTTTPSKYGCLLRFLGDKHLKVLSHKSQPYLQGIFNTFQYFYTNILFLLFLVPSIGRSIFSITQWSLVKSQVARKSKGPLRPLTFDMKMLLSQGQSLRKLVKTYFSLHITSLYK